MIYGYPTTYQPNAPKLPAVTVTLGQLQAARLRNAQSVSVDGNRIFMRRFGGWYVADWRVSELGYGAWRPVDEPGGDVIEVE